MVAEMRAEQVGWAARTDLQFTVPVRPVVRRGVRLRPSGESVVLDGADRMQAFSGAFAREGLVPLALACDGSRNHSALARHLGMHEEAVYKCLALLWSAGVVEEAPEADTSEVSAELACFLSRLGNSTGVNRSWSQAAQRLTRHPVHLSGAPALVAAVRRSVAGVCRVVTDPSEHADGHFDAPVGLMVFFETASSASLLASVEDRCAGEGIPLLRVRADDTTLTVGPYMDLEITPCLSCGRHGDTTPSEEPPEHLHDLIAGLAAHHVTALLARSTLTHLPLDSAVVDLTDLTTAHRPTTTLPGCTRCSYSRGPLASAPPAAAVYEAAVALPPRAFLNPKDHQAHYYRGNIRLQSRFRDWPSHEHTPLPSPDLSDPAWSEPSGDARQDGSPTLSELGSVLKIAFGINEEQTTDEQVKRWTAASGNIGCATAYLVQRQAGAVPRGVYAYAEATHTLATVSDTTPPGDAPCEIIVTGNLRKVMTKYGTFGFRLALLDTGCALASAREVAEHLGVSFDPRTDWDDKELALALGTSPTEEPVVGVATLGGVR